MNGRSLSQDAPPTGSAPPPSPAERVAVVSGGSRGLGLVLVQRLLEEGWGVATFSRGTPGADIEALQARSGSRLFWQQADLRLPESLHSFAKAVVRRFGRIDLLINNAALLTEGLLATTRGTTVADVIAANLVGPIALSQACVKPMMQQRRGTIVNVSSINSVRGHPGVSIYTASKAGLDGFTRSMARELGPLNIRVNSIVPGFFETDLVAALTAERRDRIARRTPLKRVAEIGEIADVAMFLASDRSSFVTGQTIIVDGGYTC
ncbi:3-oxoacyl-[acyl-carrier protein] reductase [Azospirillum baldaniorum]|nr:3-oxoacyl-[acyl-carrier protein] reductase [Azospirillum baldaniorum]